MNSSEKILFFLGSLGAFNGLILGIYIILFASKKHLSKLLLGALLMVVSIRVGKSVAFFFDYSLAKIYLQIGLTACFLIGPFLFFYIKSEMDEVKRLPRNWLWVLIFWFILIVSVGGVYPYESFPSLWRNYFIPGIYLQWGIHIAFSAIMFIPTLKKMWTKENLRVEEKMSMLILVLMIILFGCYVWAILKITKGSYISAPLIFSLIIYLSVFAFLYKEKTQNRVTLLKQKYSGSKLDKEMVQTIIEKVNKLMVEKELFKNPNLKINDLAREAHVSSHLISQILNDNIKKNFTLFVNEYRISEACRLLLENRYLTIDAVAEEVGFNAKSTFFATFKKIKGLTPAVYQQSGFIKS